MAPSRPRAAAAAVLISIGLVALECSRPDLLIVGNITVDVIDQANATGGAVSYAAVTARALGARACIVTVAAPEHAHQPGVFGGHALKVVPSRETLTFAHTYTWFGSHRKLQVTANPNATLTLEHVPLRCRRARAYLLGPLTLHDLDAASFVAPTGLLASLLYPAGSAPVGLMGQGFQRGLAANGGVLPLGAPSPQLLAGLAPHVYLFLSDVETEGWGPGTLASVAACAARVLVTLGDKGADEWRPGGGPPRRIPPFKVDAAVDTNGAGDTFGTAYMVALLRGDADPGAAAAWAASRTVMQPQSCKPRCAASLICRGGGDSMDGRVAPRLDLSDRVRLSAVALLRRVGLGSMAEALARRGALRHAATRLLGLAGVRLQSPATALAPM